jgi:hypothetical protein
VDKQKCLACWPTVASQWLEDLLALPWRHRLTSVERSTLEICAAEIALVRGTGLVASQAAVAFIDRGSVGYPSKDNMGYELMAAYHAVMFLCEQDVKRVEYTLFAIEDAYREYAAMDCNTAAAAKKSIALREKWQETRDKFVKEMQG